MTLSLAKRFAGENCFRKCQIWKFWSVRRREMKWNKWKTCEWFPLAFQWWNTVAGQRMKWTGDTSRWHCESSNGKGLNPSRIRRSAEKNKVSVLACVNEWVCYTARNKRITEKSPTEEATHRAGPEVICLLPALVRLRRRPQTTRTHTKLKLAISNDDRESKWCV